ncbi:hypothetical protein JG687_00005213 [Phytophthora cactorum]|uniref:Uncharacterized protein n=1 Tax=Phytophthora cactorum TaxID=29920 RepID=A0A8T1UR76_9STRA|nr:hypothetical protein JG687_00005213 [Phytophthora cactorum]
MPRGEKRGLPERSGNMVKHRRTASRRAAEGDEPNESRGSISKHHYRHHLAMTR